MNAHGSSHLILSEAPQYMIFTLSQTTDMDIVLAAHVRQNVTHEIAASRGVIIFERQSGKGTRVDEQRYNEGNHRR